MESGMKLWWWGLVEFRGKDGDEVLEWNICGTVVVMIREEDGEGGPWSAEV